jgi:hypothetical protein
VIDEARTQKGTPYLLHVTQLVSFKSPLQRWLKIAVSWLQTEGIPRQRAQLAVVEHSYMIRWALPGDQKSKRS